ncbi:cyclic GMP-AMP synthase-like [Huso huso]|uniref:Cyclic GMP-AMP synthase-like n=1 Tax=Huso huso TaxID=61971 RepID=A0ABR0YP81_HUSHU
MQPQHQSLQWADPIYARVRPQCQDRELRRRIKLKKQESDPESRPAAPTKRVRWQSFPVEINELASVANLMEYLKENKEEPWLPVKVLTGSPEFLLECKVGAIQTNNLRRRIESDADPAKNWSRIKPGRMEYLEQGGLFYRTNNPDEFDVMLILPTPRITWTEVCGFSGLFYRVSVCRPPSPSWILEDGLTISAVSWRTWQPLKLISKGTASPPLLSFEAGSTSLSGTGDGTSSFPLLPFFRFGAGSTSLSGDGTSSFPLLPFFVLGQAAPPSLEMAPAPLLCSPSFVLGQAVWSSPAFGRQLLLFLSEGAAYHLVPELPAHKVSVTLIHSTVSVPGWHWSLERQNPGCPAITLSLLNNKAEVDISLDLVPALEIPSCQGWPEATKKGLKIEDWLGKKSRRAYTSQSFYFVPKKPKGRGLSEEAKESWRISFSHIEKQMIKNHGKNKTCCETPATTCHRKMCLRLLKCLIQSLKERHPAELSHLCSYHGKTAFLHSLCRRCLDSHWQGRLDRCFMQLLDDFITHVEKADLPHFFISKCNLFSPRCFPKRSLELLREELLEQRRLGLTVFQLPCAEEEPALIPAAPAPQQALSNTLLFGILLLLGVFLAAVASIPLQGPV